MPRYEFKAFLTIEANDEDHAVKEAHATCDEFSCDGEWSFSLDDGPPTELEDDDA